MNELDTSPHPDPQKPPIELLSFLAHLQVSYDASYIAPISQPVLSSISALGPGEVSLNEPLSRPTPPPRTHSIPVGSRSGSAQLLGPGTARQHPSIFPPHTPHPVPSAVGADRQYVQAQGTPLRAGVWGEGALPGRTVGGAGADTLRVLWAGATREWVVVFKMSVAVSECLRALVVCSRGDGLADGS